MVMMTPMVMIVVMMMLITMMLMVEWWGGDGSYDYSYHGETCVRLEDA